ncbi:MAG: hypothetical protein WCJ30_19020, partial [Deltaproteobacteria bacterium]
PSGADGAFDDLATNLMGPSSMSPGVKSAIGAARALVGRNTAPSGARPAAPPQAAPQPQTAPQGQYAAPQLPFAAPQPYTAPQGWIPFGSGSASPYVPPASPALPGAFGQPQGPSAMGPPSHGAPVGPVAGGVPVTTQLAPGAKPSRAWAWILALAVAIAVAASAYFRWRMR